MVPGEKQGAVPFASGAAPVPALGEPGWDGFIPMGIPPRPAFVGSQATGTNPGATGTNHGATGTNPWGNWGPGCHLWHRDGAGFGRAGGAAAPENKNPWWGCAKRSSLGALSCTQQPNSSHRALKLSFLFPCIWPPNEPDFASWALETLLWGGILQMSIS